MKFFGNIKKILISAFLIMAVLLLYFVIQDEKNPVNDTASSNIDKQDVFDEYSEYVDSEEGFSFMYPDFLHETKYGFEDYQIDLANYSGVYDYDEGPGTKIYPNFVISLTVWDHLPDVSSNTSAIVSIPIGSQTFYTYDRDVKVLPEDDLFSEIYFFELPNGNYVWIQHSCSIAPQEYKVVFDDGKKIDCTSQHNIVRNILSSFKTI